MKFFGITGKCWLFTFDRLQLNPVQKTNEKNLISAFYTLQCKSLQGILKLIFTSRRFVYYFWNEWFTDVPSVEMLREISSSTNSGNKSTSENVNRTSRRSSPSIIPSLFELASGSFKLLREFNSGFKSRTSDTEQFEDGTSSPLSTPSEVRFCNSIIAECTGPEGEVQERCASNYKQWILLRSKHLQLDCNSATPNTGTTASWSMFQVMNRKSDGSTVHVCSRMYLWCIWNVYIKCSD